jgi:hypothetical protein
MKSAGGWMGGPRWDTKQGVPDTSTPSTNTTNETTTAAPVSTTPAPTGLDKLWSDNKAIIIAISILFVIMLLGSSAAAMLLVMQ